VTGITETDDRPLRKDAERNRRRILDAARALFAERGLGVTLNDIAHHAASGSAPSTGVSPTRPSSSTACSRRTSKRSSR
jgi:AcrR family transcriptional regulator